MTKVLVAWMRNRFDRRGVAPPPAGRQFTWALLAPIVVLLLTACGGGARSTPTPVPPTPTIVASPTVAPAPPSLGAVTWSTAIDAKTGAPLSPATSFLTTDKTIYAVVQAPDLPRGATLSATWSFNGTPIQIPPQTVRITHEERSSWIEFHLSWTGAGDWPDGTLKIAIALDGQPARSAEVAIKRPGGALRDDVP